MYTDFTQSLRQRRGAVLLIGAGGHGKVVADVARASGVEVVGYAEPGEQRMGQVAEPGGAQVIISQEVLFQQLERGESLLHDAQSACVAIGHNVVRLKLSRRLGQWLSDALIHPSAIISPSAIIGAGSVALPLAVVNAAAVVGVSAILNTACVVEHDCVIGDGAHISPRATLCGGVSVGARAWIGAGAVVIPGVVIGEDAVVGAGAVVIRDVPAGVTVVGSPARPLHR